jgi:SH3-like domain-containing protein
MKHILILTLLLILFSCKYKSYNIDLPITQTPSELNQWGITKYDSLKLRTGPDEKAEEINYLPLGAIVEIIKKDGEIKNFENVNDSWYFIDYKGEEGWIFGSYLDIFNNYEEAEKKSGELIFGNIKNENTKK